MQFQDLILGKLHFHFHRCNELNDFRANGSGPGLDQPNYLLGYGGRARYCFPVARFVQSGSDYRDRIESRMIPEPVVLRGYHAELQ